MNNILQFKISLNDSRPPIWRRVQIAYTSSFLDLHAVIQDAMGWEDCHLHSFSFEDKKTRERIIIGPPDEESFFEVLPEKQTLVKDWFSDQLPQCVYNYDFGDDWHHKVLLEKTLPAEPGIKYPRCIKGKRACPPEDSGGVWGYEYKLEILRNSKHQEHQMVSEWMGKNFDPEKFDVKDIVFESSDVHDVSDRID